MKQKNTLLLLLCAAGLFAFIWFYEKQQPGTDDLRQAEGQIFPFDRDDVDSIAIKNSENKIELHRVNGEWFLQEPVKDRADAGVMNQLFTTVESTRAEQTLKDEGKGMAKEQLKEIGLSNPDTKIKFISKGKSTELVLGRDTAVEGKIYAKLESGDAVFVINKELKDRLAKKADEFRDHRLTNLQSSQVTQFVIKSSAGELELVKQDQHWSIAKPLKARGDDSRIGDLVAQITAMKIESFVDNFANVSTYGLQEPTQTISLKVDGVAQPIKLDLGTVPAEVKDKDKVYAKLTTRDPVVLLPKTVAALLQVTPNELRDKQLLRVAADIVDRITIAGSDGEKVVLARDGESWVRKTGANDQAINASAAQRALDELRKQEVEKFVSDVATDLAKYGLDQPKLKVVLSSYASENTAETKAGDKPIVTVWFGNTDGDLVYAKLEEEPFIVAVPRTLVDVLMPDPLQWQPLEINRAKPEDFVDLEISREPAPPLTLHREGAQWKLGKGDDVVNQINVQSLVNTLANLRAVRWAGAITPEQGLAKPTMTISYKGNNFAGKLVIGASTPEDYAYAAADGKTGTFVVSKPDLTALQLPLMERSAQPTNTPAVAPANQGLPIPANLQDSLPTPKN